MRPAGGLAGWTNVGDGESVRHIPLRWFPLLAGVLLMSACTVGGPRPASGPEFSALAFSDVGARDRLAGEWEYEDGAVLTLRLDEQGNGTYEWKEGRFETQALNGHLWRGVWIQRENDREGGFLVELSPDFTEGDGRWWYTRIGDNPSPSEKGGTFHLSRKSTQASLSDTPPAP